MIVLLLVTLMVAFAIRRLYRMHNPPQLDILKNIPHEPFLPIVGSNVPRQMTDMRDYLLDEWQTMGSPVMHKFMDEINIHIFRADQVEKLMKSTKNITKGFNYGFLEKWFGRGLLTSTGAMWHRQRKQLTPTFHYKILDDFALIMNDCSRTFVKKLEAECDQFDSAGKGYYINDICPYITLCALDIITETSMGARINAQQRKSHPYGRAIAEFMEAGIERTVSPWQWNDAIYFNALPSGRKCAKTLRTLKGFTEKVIVEREAEHRAGKIVVPELSDDLDDGNVRKPKLAFLDLLLDMMLKGEMSETEVREQVDTFMFEGHDTTAHGLIWTLFYLASHKEYMSRVQEELDDVMDDDRSRSPTNDELSRMKYMECCIKEALRMMPPVPMMERVVTDELKIDDKYTLPLGTTVGVSIYQLHHDPEHFPEPEVYDPERFNAENSKGRHPYAYIPFSAGLRNCIGQRFAMMEMKIVLGHLLRNLTFEAMDANAMETNYAIIFITRPLNGMKMKVFKRPPRND